jgi:hypothetical protein
VVSDPDPAAERAYRPVRPAVRAGDQSARDGPTDPDAASDARILARLLDREHAAHKNLGDAAAVMGEWDADAEEDAIKKMLSERASARERAEVVDEAAPEVTGWDDWGWTGPVGTLNRALAAGDTTVEGGVEIGRLNRLFDENLDVVRLVAQRAGADLVWREEDQILSLDPPEDLSRRFDVLPVELVRGLRLHEKVKVTGDKDYAKRELSAALRRRMVDRELNPDQRAAAAWPEVGYLTDEHPVTAWAVDRALCLFDRGVAPVIATDKVTDPVVLCAGVWSNKQGEPLAVRWAGVKVFTDGRIAELAVPPEETFSWLVHDLGLDDTVPNRGGNVNVDSLQQLIPTAVEVAATVLTETLSDLREEAERDLADTKARLERWEHHIRALADEQTSPAVAARYRNHADRVAGSVNSLIANMTPAGSPHIRVVAVIAGADQ